MKPVEKAKPSRMKKLLAPLGILGVLLWKLKFIFVPLLKFGKFLPAILKTGGTMLLSIGVYAIAWGWKFAAGFVLLIFIHECGHLLAARHFGLRVTAPMFIPFLGAFILLKDSTRDAWVEAWVGISGPILGAVGSAICHIIYLLTGETLFGGLAFSGYFLNLFNLAPVGFLDGGHIVTALSPWLWIVGAVFLIGTLFVQFNFIVVLILIASVPRLLSLFRKKTEEEKRYFQIKAWQRVVMALMYFMLIGGLLYMMSISQVDPNPPPAPALQ
ncbi:MAG: hypothetical protein QOF48_538 [Verrucomicrobiota bacterium]